MKVGWRSTQLRMLGNSVVVVPNSKLAGNVIINFSLPKDEMAVTIDVGVSYQSDLEQVQRVTLEVAREIAVGVEGAIATSEPRLRFIPLPIPALTSLYGSRRRISSPAWRSSTKCGGVAQRP